MSIEDLSTLCTSECFLLFRLKLTISTTFIRRRIQEFHISGFRGRRYLRLVDLSTFNPLRTEFCWRNGGRSPLGQEQKGLDGWRRKGFHSETPEIFLEIPPHFSQVFHSTRTLREMVLGYELSPIRVEQRTGAVRQAILHSARREDGTVLQRILLPPVGQEIQLRGIRLNRTGVHQISSRRTFHRTGRGGHGTLRILVLWIDKSRNGEGQPVAHFDSTNRSLAYNR